MLSGSVCFPLNLVKMTRSWIRSIFIASHGRCRPPIPRVVQQWTRLRNAVYSRFSGRADREHKLVLEWRFFVCCINTERVCTGVATCNFCHSMPTSCESICCQELDNIRDLLVGDPVPAYITRHTDLLVQNCIVDCLSWAPTPIWN